VFQRTFRRAAVGEVTDTMIGLRGEGHASWKSSRVEICIAVADWARGLTTWVLGVPGGGSTDATRRKPPRLGGEAVLDPVWVRVSRIAMSDVSNVGSISCGRGAGMVVGWG
jgi:hypothetical protein